jgi:hypothetical protein
MNRRDEALRESNVDEQWTGRCLQTPPIRFGPLTSGYQQAYGRKRPEGAQEPTNGQDRITAHVAWKVPSGRSTSPS